jgi:aminoglycoside 6'-N-acetyltransferase
VLGTGDRPWPLDLSGTPKVFVVDLPPGCDLRPEPGVLKQIDVELEAKAGWVPTGALRFRRLTHRDLPALLAWQHAPHVSPWLPHWLDQAGVERRYGPRIAGVEPIRMHILEVAGRPAGYLQHYLVHRHRDYLAAIGDRHAAAIDFIIGDGSLTGRGLGPRMIWQYLRDVVLVAYPAIPRVVASPAVANRRAVRALAKAGFRPAGMVRVAGQPEPERVCVQDRASVWGAGRRAGPTPP